MSNSDRNLLFGVIALQMDFLTRDQLVAGMQAWVLDKAKSLDEILVAKGLLSAADRDSLLPMMERHIQKHDGSPTVSLKALSSITPSVRVLEELDDSELHASLQSLQVSRRPASNEGPVTVSFDVLKDSTRGRYQVLRPHARGGLGEVFVARDTELDRQVALKEILGHQVHNSDSRSRFVMEGEITGKLEHPGIVPVYGLGAYDDGRPFYAMRFIEGDTLHKAIRDFHKQLQKSTGPLEHDVEFRKLLGRFVDICNAVGYAHSRGVLHRDLKPGNVMLGQHGETLVVDWGLAKVQGVDDPENTGSNPINLQSGSGTDQTLPGSAIGTPGYMSPEQANGQIDKLGPATDIYSLGAILYTLLTGDVPLRESQFGEFFRRVSAGDFPKPRDKNSAIPKPLEAICLRALATDHQNRYATCSELADDIERYLADEPVAAFTETFTAKTSRIARKHRGVVRASAVALLVVAMLSAGAALWINVEKNRAVSAEEEANKQQLLAEASERRARREAAIAGQEKIAARAAAREADEQRLVAEDRQIKIKNQLYLSNIYRAAGDFEAGRRVQANTLLNSIPVPERNWEHRYISRQVAGTTFTLRGHTGWVNDVAYGPKKGYLIVSGGGDRSVRVWDTRTGDEVLALRGHTNDVNSAAFSPDGTRIVSGGADDTVKVWDVRTGLETFTLRGHTDDVRSARFSPDGTRIVSASWDNTAKVWDARTGLETQTLRGHTSFVTSAAFSPDSTRIVSGGGDDTVKVWDALNGSEIFTLHGHKEPVNSAAFSPDGTRIVTGSSDDTVKVWDAQTQSEAFTLRGHQGPVISVRFSPDSTQIVSGSADSTVKVWDARTGKELLTFRGHDKSVTGVAFSPDGTRIASSSGDGTVKVWDVVGGSGTLQLACHEDCFETMAFSPDGTHIVSGDEGGNVQVWDMRTGEELFNLRGHSERINSVEFSPDGTLVVSGSGKLGPGFSEESTVKVWDAQTGFEVFTLKGHRMAVTTVAFSPRSDRIVSGSWDKTLRVWDVRSGTQLLRLRGHLDRILGAAFSPDGTRIVSSSADNSVRVWNARTGDETLTLREGQGWIDSVAFGENGTRIATGNEDGSVKVRDAVTGEEVLTLKGHTTGVTSLAFSPDDSRIISGSWDDTVKVWDARSGAETLTLRGHRENVLSVAFSLDGTRIVSGSEDGIVKVWDARADAETVILRGHTGKVTRAAFNREGNMLASCSGDGTMIVWDARTGTRILAVKGRSRWVTDGSFSPDGNGIIYASHDNTLKVRDLQTGDDAIILSGHEGSIICAAFSPDGTRIVAGYEDGTVKVWDARTEAETLCLAGHNLSVSSVAFSSDGESIVSSSLGLFSGMPAFLDRIDPEVKVWDAVTGAQIRDESESEPVDEWAVKNEWVVTTDGKRRVTWTESEILLINMNLEYNPWAEDTVRRKHRDPIYHEREATAAENAKDWFAARFHLRWLVKHDPENAAFQERLAIAEAKYTAGETSRPAIAEKMAK